MKNDNLLDNETLNKIVNDVEVDNSDLTDESLEPVEPTDDRSNEQKIKDAFEAIESDEYSRNHTFYEIKRNWNKKGYIAKKKFTYFKHRFDKCVPLVACLCIAVVIYAYFAVQEGWITGSKYQESTELVEENGYVYEGEDETVAAAKAYFDGSKTYNELDIGGDDSSSETSEVDSGIDLKSATSSDITHLDESPENFFDLWDKLVELGYVPEDAELVSSSIDSSSSNNIVVVLEFNDEFQTYADSQSDTEFLQTIADDFYALNSDYANFTFTVGETPLTVGGEEVGTITAK